MKVTAIALMGSDLFDYVADRLGNDKDYTVLFNLCNQENKILKSNVNMNEIDLIVVDISLFAGACEENILSSIYAGTAQNEDGFPPDYLMIYNNENAEEVVWINDILLKRKITMTSVCLNDEADKVIVAQNIRGIIKRQINEKKRFSIMDNEMRKIQEY